MKQRPKVAVLNTVEAAAANILNNTFEWAIQKTSAGHEILLGPIRTGKIVRVESFDPAAEVRQIIGIGLDATPEVITASTRYKIEIGNPEDRYETFRRFPIVHAYTTPAALTGTAATDRLNVYTALVAKVNAYAGNNATASLVTVADFTLGTDGAGTATNFTPGETVTQETSTNTAKVAKAVITSGTMAGNDAAGKIYLYDVAKTGWLTTAKTLTGGTSLCVATVTNATTVHDQGMVVIDDAGYFTSTLGRGGVNWVGAPGWATSVAEVLRAGVYSQGIGSVIAQLIPRYDHAKQDLLSGFMEYELQAGDAWDITKTYRKYVITVADGDQEAMAGNPESANQQYILYADFGSGNLADFNNALVALT